MPQFISDDPEMWLQLVEKSFILSNIVNEDTKFSYVVTSLDPRVVHEVRDIIMKPPSDKPYTALKTTLVNRLSASQEQKTRQLLEKEEMCDSKPSQFLRRLRVLAGPSVSDDLLRTLWTGRLPQNIQAILATQKRKRHLTTLQNWLMQSWIPYHPACVLQNFHPQNRSKPTGMGY